LDLSVVFPVYNEAGNVEALVASSKIAAKGVEDTAFYRYYPLASLNEVGGDPEHFGVSLNKFHRRNLIRRELWPHGMISTATHDTKRGEDARARILTLSEVAGEWSEANVLRFAMGIT